MSKKNRKSQPRKSRKWLWIILAVLLVIVAAVAGWYCIRYQFNGEYKQYLSQPYAVETGAAFAPLGDESPAVEGYELAAENDILKLYVDTETAQVAIHDLRNGQTVYSNPPEADNDARANKTNKNYLKSQFILEYINASRTSGTFDSYSMSVALGQVQAESIENGVRFTYEVGEKSEIDYYIPYYLSKEKYDELFAKLGEDDQALLGRSWILNESTGLYEVIKAGRSNRSRRMKLDEMLQRAGFTQEEYFEQMALGGEEQKEDMTFIIALEYRLDGDGVEVSMPVSLMEEKGGGYISRIHLLRFLGAGSSEESGYMVVPNGSGSLINFNNGKNTSAVYSQYIYDLDLVDAEYTKTQNTMPVRLPLFGICREDSSVLATIECGATLASISADVAGRYNTYNYVYPSFTLRGDDKLSMFGVSGNEADMPIVEKNLYDENITVRYTLLGEDYKGYSGVANYYRERLIAEGLLTRMTAEGDIPLYYDVIGGVKETAHTMGIQYLRVTPMTTFEQAAQIAQSLSESGVTSQVMNFQGWMNGGYYHDAADGVWPLWELGGKKGLEALSASLENLGGEFFADVAFQNVTEIAKRYLPTAESSRYYGAGYVVQLGQVNPTTLRRTSGLGYEETRYYLLSPKFLPHYVQGFASAIENYHINGISLRDLGDQVHSDKRRTEVISREQALSIVTAQLDTLADTGKDMMVSGGNIYALKHASHVISAPLSDTEYFMVDQGIPLYEMIVHGCVDYTGEPLNTLQSASWKEDMLRLIEYGASPRYVFTYQDATAMKYTGLNRYSATTFADWQEEAVASWKQLSSVLSPVRSACMVAHEAVTEELVRVAYDNGMTLWINYGAQDAQVDGLIIPAQDCLMVGGEAQ